MEKTIYIINQPWKMKWKQEEEGCRKKEKKHVAIKSEDKKRNSLLS